MKICSSAAGALQTLEQAGYESYIVGGCVRDQLLGREPHDWDITTAALPEEVERVFAGKRVLETGLRHGTVTLLTEDGPLEITTFRTEGGYSDGRHPDRVDFVSDIREDLARRDFTVNAMAYSPRRGLVDPFGGQTDLNNRILRCVGEPDRRLTEDSLRILRALRFAARFDLTIEPETAEALRRLRAGLQRVSAERIFSELKGILCAPGAGKMLRAFPEVVFTVLPELAPSLGFDQRRPENHVYDVWEHILHAVDAVSPEPVLRLAVLFHDSGKPATYAFDRKAGFARFRNHPTVSAALAEQALTRLRCDNDTREAVCTLVANHEMRAGHSRCALRRLMADIGEENMHRLMLVRRADAAAHAPGAAQRLLLLAEEDEAHIRDILSHDPCLSKKDMCLSGGDLLAAGWEKGPGISDTMERLFSEILDENLENTREALLHRALELKEAHSMDEVKITWLGHSCFRMEYKGWSLVTDPYGDGSVPGLPPLRVKADRVYKSHDHGDHSALGCVTCSGRAAPAEFSVEEFDTAHDHHEGKHRGRNTVRIFRFGSLRVAHLGDVGSLPGDHVLSALRGVDCLLLPIGGYYTVSAEEARELCRWVVPRCIVPMHYRGEGFGYEVIGTLEEFTGLFPDTERLEGSSFTLTSAAPRGVVVPKL